MLRSPAKPSFGALLANRTPPPPSSTKISANTRRQLQAILAKNKYGTVQELRHTFSHTKSINIDFSLVWFVSLCVDF